jgi:polynucleotide 5'-hydroxyl-kinase GRC3/NOL9
MEEEIVSDRPIEVPPRWEQLDLDRLRGTVLVIGAPDSGKTTLGRYLYAELVARGQRVAFLDGDPGQSSLGVPTTMTIALSRDGDPAFPPRGRRWQRFVGSITPARQMLPVVVGACRLVREAQRAGADAILYDTSGLVDRAQGGAALKMAKVDLLQPAALIAIQRRSELEAILLPLRRSAATRVVELQPAHAARCRERGERQAHRRAMYADYFRAAAPLMVGLRDFAVVPPSERFVRHRLVALEDAGGFVLGLGVALQDHIRERRWTVLTPLESLERVDMLRLGDVALDPDSWKDRLLH